MFTNAMQLKGRIKNRSKETGVPANVLLQNFFMERLLERISRSQYREKVILKGGFLIAAMVGADKRSTMDMDTTLKNMPVSIESIEAMFNEVIAIDVDDGVIFEVQSINNIHEAGEYDNFRVSVTAKFQTINMSIKVDITTGDIIIPGEVEYTYKLMFEGRSIHVMAYNLYTILAEKVETILSRNISNTRARDFYDAYILLLMNEGAISREELRSAIKIKAEERGSGLVIENYAKHLRDIAESPEIAKIWAGYTKNYPYAKDIALTDILTQIRSIFA